MKILLLNRNFFLSGGPERYMFSLMENMKHHEFVPFCVNFDQNIETKYSKYFLNPPGGKNNIQFNEFKMSFFKKCSFALNMIYSFRSHSNLSLMIKEVKPDIALFLNGVHFSDSIIDACKNNDIPIIWRLSDFHKICANYLLFRDGKICESCLQKGLVEILKNKCGGYQRSIGVSLVKYAGMQLSRFRNIYDYISYYIVPSSFSRNKMIEGGFPPGKLIHIPTFVIPKQHKINKSSKDPIILYVGRLSPEKGINVLINAFGLIKNRKAKLFIAGDLNNTYARTLLSSVPNGLSSRIKFLGNKSQKEISVLYDICTVVVVPSLWYENQPNVVLEGMAHSKPVIASRLGSLIELIHDGKTGYHFEAGNIYDLANIIDSIINNPESAIRIGVSAYEYVKLKHSKEQHIEMVEDLFHKC